MHQIIQNLCILELKKNQGDVGMSKYQHLFIFYTFFIPT